MFGSLANLYLFTFGVLLIGRRQQKRSDSENSDQGQQGIEKQQGPVPNQLQQEVFLKPELAAASAPPATVPTAYPVSAPVNPSVSDQPPPQSFMINGILYQAMPVQLQETGRADISGLAGAVELPSARSTVFRDH